MKKEEISRLCKRIETLDDMVVEIRKRLDALEQWNEDQLDMANQINLRVAPEQSNTAGAVATLTEQRNALQVEVMDLKKRVAELTSRFKDRAAVAISRARDIARIAEQRDALQEEVAKIAQNVCGECMDEEGISTGWCHNAVEGKHVCGCIEESEPYQVLKAEVDRIAKDVIGDDA